MCFEVVVFCSGLLEECSGPVLRYFVIPDLIAAGHRYMAGCNPKNCPVHPDGQGALAPIHDAQPAHPASRDTK